VPEVAADINETTVPAPVIRAMLIVPLKSAIPPLPLALIYVRVVPAFIFKVLYPVVAK
jgi:hypothetical protein